MASIRDRCPTCGFDPVGLTPADAAVAARSFPRRYRAVLVRPADEEDGAEVVLRRPPGGWSAVEHASYAADAIALVADAVRGLGIGDHPTVNIDPGSPQSRSVEAALEWLETATEALARAVEQLPSDAWKRTTATAAEAGLTAGHLARHAAHVGSHHLREAQRAVDATRGRR